MIFSGIITLCLLGLSSSAPGKLPDTFPRCKRNDPQIDKCLKDAVDVAFPQMKNGVQSLGLFPLDPLEIKALDIGQGTGPVAIDLKFRDLKIKGLSSAKIMNVKTDLDNYKIDLQGDLQEPLYLDGKYEVNGNVLVLPIVGKGDSHLKLDNVKATVSLHGKERVKDGKKYMDVEKVDLVYDTTRLHMQFDNLFSQDKALADNLNTFLNDNWQEIHKELKPAIQEAFGQAFKAIASRIMNKVPYDDIFLP